MTAFGEGSRLIVHGDDFGLSEGVNRAVIEAHEKGILTSTSVMATGDAFEHAVVLAKACPTLDVGVHLTLTGQRPVLEGPSVASLVDAKNRFAPHAFQFATRYLRGGIPLAAVRAEFDAQIRRALKHGLNVSHLDGHQHVHVLPGIAQIVADLARSHGIRAVRCPAERLRAYMLKDIRRARRVAEQLVLNAFCAFSPLRKLKRSDFVGFYFGGRLAEVNLMTLLHSLPAGRTTEIMCHPGFEDAGGGFRHWEYSWSAELAALTSPRIREFLDARDVRLISYQDL